MDRKTQDLAWNCLPREFREEVKRMWSVEGDCAIKYKSELHKHRTGLMYELFGDNLNSDAEGEEMLMVSRKDVQKLYKDYCAERENKVSWDLTILMCSGGIQALEDLFGSACLPDEAEEAPAAPRFNVGDWVCCEDVIGKVKEHDDGDKSTLVEFIGDVPMTIWVADKDLAPCDGPREKNFPYPTKTIGGIIKDSSRNERRLNVAVQILSALIVSHKGQSRPIKRALELADALIAACEKGGTE